MTLAAPALSLDNAANLVLIVGILFAAWWGLHSRSTRDALRDSADAWKEERDAERAKADRIGLEKQALLARIGELEARVKELEAKTDLSMLAQQQTKLYESAMNEMRAGFEDLHKQSTGIVSLLSLMADRMGPDPKDH